MPDHHNRTLPGWKRWLGHFVQHVRDDWPAAIFVAASFAVLDNWVGWLDAINGHGFLAIGNAAGVPHAVRGGEHKALVVEIDQSAAEARYLDRSPLDRCELLADLGAVYASMKRHGAGLLVIDLDLSPARWLLTDAGRQTKEAGCQARLYELIREAAYGKPAVRTVLMEPFEAADPALRQAQDEWRKEMLKPPDGPKPADGPRTSGVTLAQALVPVKYGLVIKQYCDERSLAAAAYGQAVPSAPLDCDEPEFIDPRKYRADVILLPVSAGPDGPGSLEASIDEKFREHGAAIRAVFFGAAFGQGDTFVTPLGELYGVEIHAAGFLSFLDPIVAENHLTELIVDIVYGFLFGYLIAWFWERYFDRRLSANSDRRLLAPLWLIGLTGAIVVAAIVLTIVSWWLLASFGLWLSPIPMAIGMLIESFTSGSVAEGIRQANELKGTPRPPRRSFRESAKKFFWQDIFTLAANGKTLSAALLTIRLAIWLAAVAGALYFAVH